MPAAPKADPRVRDVLDRFQELDADRAGVAETWTRIGELVSPGRDFTMKRQAGELRTRHLRDPIGVLSAKRLSSFLFGYQLSPTIPFVEPFNLDRDPKPDEQAWFDAVELRMHQTFTGPSSVIATQLAEAFLDLVSINTTVTFRPKTMGGVPRLVTLPMIECYLGENADAEVDTLYRKFVLRARQAAKRWPAHAAIGAIAEKDPRRDLTFVQAIEPRAGGRRGARGDRKPWTNTLVLHGPNVMVEDDSGFDTFRFQVGRFERRAGEAYGTGPGWDAYPAIWTANAMSESIVRAAELAVDPILYGDPSIFGGRLDRRPGAFNPVSGQAMFAQNMRDVVGRIDLAGDVGLGVQMLERQRQMVEAAFYMDWLALGEGPQKTATEIIDRRDVRLRMLAPLVARFEQEWLNPMVEDFFTAMLEAGMFPTPPASLAGANIGFRYRSPLALAQQGQFVDAIRQTFAITREAMAVDPAAGAVLNADAMVRDAAQRLGVKGRQLKSFEELQGLKAQAAEEAAAVRDAALEKDAAGALQAAGQGAASLAQIGA